MPTVTTAPLPPWVPGSAAAKAVRPLLDQQFFCWGEDIKRADGNLLCQYGFTRLRADETKPGCSRYELLRKDGSKVVLWGGSFLFLGSDGWGVFFIRAHFRPRLVTPDVSLDRAWCAADVSTLGPPQNREDAARLRQLLGESFAWIAMYETWVRSEVAEAWRAEMIARWWKLRTPAPDTIARWQTLSRQATME